jgi:hypothetical protein
MKILAALALLLFVTVGTPVYAAGKGKHPLPYQAIVEVDPSSITLRLGAAGDKNETLKITDATKITLDGTPVAARDLMAGMSAQVKKSADPTIAESIAARDAQLRHKR